jgi:uncharacterized protein
MAQEPVPPTGPVPAATRGATPTGGRALLAFAVLAFGLSWAWVIPQAVGHEVVQRGQGWPTEYPALLGPVVAALFVAAATAGRAGVAGLVRRLLRWRVGLRWWLVALSPTAFLGIALLGMVAAGLDLPRPADFGLFSGTPALGVPAVFLMITLIGGVGEETGWRGFALPRLQRRLGPLAASLVLAALWASWHLPQFFVVATYRAFGVVEDVGFVVGLTCGAIVLTWLYNRSGGSILLVVVWHGVYNLVGGTQGATGVVAAVVSMLVVAQGLVLAGLHVRARRRGLPSPLRPVGASLE